MINSLLSMPNGVFRITPGIPDLVETSSNLAQIRAQSGIFQVLSMQRSSSESGLHHMAQSVYAAFAPLPGVDIVQDGEYPGWEPNLNSKILEVIKNTYNRLFHADPKILACHAGLECGIIGEKYPDLDMISIGPTIKHPHSPDEKVQIASVQKYWTLLQNILIEIPVNAP
jgi:dipeptidase D